MKFYVLKHDYESMRPLNAKIIAPKVKKQLLSIISPAALKLFIKSREKFPRGSYIYGDGPPHYTFPIV